MLEQLAAEPRAVEFVKLNIDENPVAAVALRRALDPDRDPVRRTASRARRSSARGRAALRARARGGCAQPPEVLASRASSYGSPSQTQRDALALLAAADRP